jgi:hypothetical protein
MPKVGSGKQPFRDMLKGYSNEQLREISDTIETILDERFYARRGKG